MNFVSCGRRAWPTGRVGDCKQNRNSSNKKGKPSIEEETTGEVTE